VLEEATEFVGGALERMGIEASVEGHESEEAIIVEISSAETGLVIGQKGETIDALQHLTNAVVYRDRSFYKKIVLDSEGYRQRRVEAIQGMAHRAARRAARAKQDVRLPPMSSQERRVVHLFLQDNQEVTSASVGKSESRRVVISPLRKSE
jgi:spoIIIJ-associated protein